MRKKPSLLLVVSFLFISLSSYSGLPSIIVAENTLKISAFGEEVFYYGFAEGDQIVFDFEELKGKELKEVEIMELPSFSKFMDYKTKKIENKTITISKTGIYKFRFTNTGLGGRICKFKIQRIPAGEETRNFNCAVYWRKEYDSIKRTVQERYLIKSEKRPEQVLEPTKLYVNGGRNSMFLGGKSRVSVPVMLPKNTIEWYYIFSASRTETEIDKTRKSMNLIGDISRILDKTRMVEISVDMLTKPPGGDICDVYLLDINNKGLFEEKSQYQHYLEGTRENISSGVVKIKSALFINNFLGIKNPDPGYGIHVVIEAVAITNYEEWGVRDVIKYDVSSRDVPYLKN